VIDLLEVPAKPKIMIRDATRDAWVRDAAFELARGKRMLDALREAALDPRTPVPEAAWAAAKAKVAAMGAEVARADRNGVRGDAFKAMTEPYHHAIYAATHLPPAPTDPKARERWKADGEAVLATAREAVRALDELAADTGVDPFASHFANGDPAPSSRPEHWLDAAEQRLAAPPPGKLDAIAGLVKAAIEVAGAVEVAPNGQLRERRR
jgi:hypothetical protein